MMRLSVLAALLSLGVAQHSPDARGTLLPNGKRWGTFDVESKVLFDKANVFASQDIELLASGFRWTEGPLSTPQGLLFTDTIQDRIYLYDGEVSVALEKAGGGAKDVFFGPGANGLAYRDDETLLVCQHGAQRVVALDATDFHLKSIVASETPKGDRFNSPNDVCVVGNKAYFTDPTYGFLLKGTSGIYPKNVEEKGLPDDQPYLDELSLVSGAKGEKGIYAVDLETSKIELISTALDRPNGIGFFRNHLWVANSAVNNCSWYAFDLETNEIVKTISWDSLDVDMGPGLIDGFEFDLATGLLWSSAPGGVIVVDTDKGEAVAAAKFGLNIANLAFGKGKNHKFPQDDVFVTGLGHLWRLKKHVSVLHHHKGQEDEL